MSVAAAASRISTPSTSKWIGNPQKLKLGWRVSSTTTSSGTKKIRRVVKLLGRFMKSPEKPLARGPRAFQRSFHYSPAFRGSQRRRRIPLQEERDCGKYVVLPRKPNPYASNV